MLELDFKRQVYILIDGLKMNESIEGDTSDEHLPDMETVQNHHQGAGIEGAQDQESAGEMEEGDEARSDKGEGGTKIFYF